MAQFTRPTSRDEFHVAIICALTGEADAVMLLFDLFWDEDGDTFGRAAGDNNYYTTGRLGKHNVVLAVLPGMGTNSAASATASLRASYGSLRLVFLVGVCGGVPRVADEDVFLGDVVVSKAVVQYDLGRQHPEHFQVKNTVEDSLGRANKDIRGMLALLETNHVKNQLQIKSATYMTQLQSAAAKAAKAAKRRQKKPSYQYPGITKDKLYRPEYIHRHAEQCHICGKFDTCAEAATTSCADLRCEEAMLVIRDMPSENDNDYIPNIFIGRIGSGNTVMRSGEIRDWMAKRHNLIAFEMEGAGAWDEVPCLVVKGVCDYADSHKNKEWQGFAAATAASVMKAILDRYTVTDGAQLNGNAGRSVTGNTFGNNVRIVQGDVTWNGTW
ncbi:purine and uridine phosphorylase [Trichoderma austrokoningii]